jgi:2-keto-4-pentenoate hydratase/2-oxohepta-3-ene-1,7-dioic acid hydratase in catechol pathway
MKLGRLGSVGEEIPVVWIGDEAFDLRSITSDIDGRFWAGGVERVREAVGAGTLPPLRGWRQFRVGAPIARPQAFICIGMNSAKHARESGSEPSTEPVVFFKHPNTIVGPQDDIFLPPGATKNSTGKSNWPS